MLTNVNECMYKYVQTLMNVERPIQTQTDLCLHLYVTLVCTNVWYDFVFVNLMQTFIKAQLVRAFLRMRVALARA